MLYKSTIATYTKERTCGEDNEKQIHACQTRRQTGTTLKLHSSTAQGAALQENVLWRGAGGSPELEPLLVPGSSKDNPLEISRKMAA